jgi:hypothetical protein
VRGQGDPIPSGDDSGQDRAGPDERGSPASDTRDNDAAGDERAEPRGRETYADDMRADPPDADRESVPAGGEGAGAPDDAAEGTHGEAGMEPAVPRSRDEYAEVVRDGSLNGSAADQPSRETGTGWPADPSDDRGMLTHYHSEFKDQPVDLYTDGSRWAAGERVDGENVVGEKPDKSPGDTSDLPPTGEQLISMESDKASRAERMRQEGYREAGDVLDVTSKWTDVAHGLLARDRPSGHAEISTRPEISAVPHQGINPGDAASALVLFTALGAEAIGLGVKSWHERKGHEDGSKR